jgi:hypothetical protein
MRRQRQSEQERQSERGRVRGAGGRGEGKHLLSPNGPLWPDVGSGRDPISRSGAGLSGRRGRVEGEGAQGEVEKERRRVRERRRESHMLSPRFKAMYYCRDYCN